MSDEFDDKPAPKILYEFQCEVCDCECPYPDGFGHGDEVLCYYCGAAFAVKIVDGKVTFKDL